ncbi:MAG: hypothetical protein ACRD7E_32330 [Bryobacteraceae bacterium]
MFLFEQMFDTALNGIVSSGVMSGILTVAYAILLASVLFAAYEAWMRGGDVRALGTAAVKYLALGLLFVNGGAVYDSVFRSLVGAFNQMSHNLAGIGAVDVLRAWMTEIGNAMQSLPTALNLVTGLPAGILSALLLLVAAILYPIAYTIFAIFYSLFGTILYVAGPLVLSLMPTMGLGMLARRYAVNLCIFATWGLIYGIFCRLAIALNIHSMAAITGAGSFAGAFQGASAEVLLSAASILFSVCILLIPMLAKRVVEGDIGSSMLLVMSGLQSLVNTAVALAGGAAGAFGGIHHPDPPDPPGGGGGGGGAKDSSGSGKDNSGNSGGSSSPPPRPPSGGGNYPGNFNNPVNTPHAIGWLADAAAALAVKGGQNAVNAGKSLVSKPPQKD